MSSASATAGSALVSARETAAAALRGLVSGIRDTLNIAAQAASRLTQGLSAVATVIAPILNVVRLVLTSISVVLQGLNAIVGIVSSLLAIIRSLLSILGMLFNVLKSIFQALFAILQAVGRALVSLFSAIGNSVSNLAGHVSTHFGTMLKYALGITAAIAAAFVAAALSAEHAWTPVAQTIGRIKIAGVGQAAIAGLRDFAREVRRATLTASADVLTLAEQAARLRVPEDQLKAVTAAALGLSTALGISASDAMAKLVPALRGDYDGLKNLIPALRGATTDTERLAIIMKAAQEGIDLGGQKVNTFAGLWQSFKNVLAENAVVLGEKIQPGITKIVTALRPLLGLLETTGNAFANVFNMIADNAAPVITMLVDWFAQLYAGFIAFGQTVLHNWQATWELIQLTVIGALLTLKNVLVQFFTAVLPAYFDWFKQFSSNWVSALGEGLRVGFTNLWLNLGDIAAAGWQGIRARMRGDQASAAAWFNYMGQQWTRSLVEGFQGAEIPALPKIAERVVSPVEQGIRDRIKELLGALGFQFGKNFDKQLEGFRDILAGKGANILRNQAGLIQQLGGADGKGKSDGNNLLESRFLTRAPGGLSPTDKLLTEANRLHEQHLESLRKAAAIQANTQARMDAIAAQMARFQVEVLGNN